MVIESTVIEWGHWPQSVVDEPCYPMIRIKLDIWTARRELRCKSLFVKDK